MNVYMGLFRRFGIILCGASLSFAPAHSQTEVGAQWSTHRGKPPPAANVPVCLFRDKSGFLGLGKWQAAVALPFAQPCTERFLVDLDSRKIYFDFEPFFEWYSRGNNASPKADAYCWGTEPFRGYGGCTSSFFQPMEGAAGASYKVATDVSHVLDKVGALGALEAMRTSLLAERQIASYNRYREEYAAATDLQRIDRFIEKYAGSDQDHLIPSLEERRRKLVETKYRAKFASAQSVGDLDAFISEYEGADPDGLIPLARKKRATEQARIQARARKEEQQKKLSQAEGDIRRCNRLIKAAYDTLARERRIAAISGYESKQALYQAGRTITSCEDFIPQRYREYRKLGGSKPLSQLD